LVIAKVDSRLAIHGIEHVNAGILHEFLAPWQLGRGKISRRFFKAKEGEALTAIFIPTQVEIDWKGMGNDAGVHSTAKRPSYSLYGDIRG